jgi:hypothetical protein
MSFVITPISRKITVQVSDTRITSFGGKSVLSETQRKTLVVLGSQARFVVGWVGMALDATFRHNTGEWLYETLRDMDAITLTIDEIARRLESLATTYVAGLTAGDKRLVFVMTGWQDSEPFIAMVSNYHTVINKRSPDDTSKTHHIPDVTEASVAAPTFKGNVQRYAKKTEQDYVVNAFGDFDSKKLQPAFMGLERLMKKQVPASEIAGACRRITLEASTHSKTKTIGRNLIGVELDISGKSQCWFYSENELAATLIPPILGIEGSSRSAKIIYMRDGTVSIEAKTTKRTG